MTWTNERLDDLAEAMRTGFGRLDEDIRGLRSELHAGDAALRAEMREGDQSLRAEIGDLRTEMREGFQSLRATMFGVGGGIIVSLIGVIGAILARGA